MGLFKNNSNNSSNINKDNNNVNDLEKVNMEIISILKAAFNISDEEWDTLVKVLDNKIEVATKDGILNYEQLISDICNDYDETQRMESIGHQLLGAYIAYLLTTGEPLRLDKNEL